MVDLIGSWSLESSILYRNDEPRPTFGKAPQGQIIYAEDGRMSALLMDPAWAKQGSKEADPTTEFFAYGGEWKRKGNEVFHTVLFASAPKAVGTVFKRTINVLTDDKIELITAAETTKSGAIYVTKLVWNRVKAAC